MRSRDTCLKMDAHGEHLLLFDPPYFLIIIDIGCAAH